MIDLLNSFHSSRFSYLFSVRFGNRKICSWCGGDNVYTLCKN